MSIVDPYRKIKYSCPSCVGFINDYFVNPIRFSYSSFHLLLKFCHSSLVPDFVGNICFRGVLFKLRFVHSACLDFQSSFDFFKYFLYRAGVFSRMSRDRYFNLRGNWG